MEGLWVLLDIPGSVDCTVTRQRHDFDSVWGATKEREVRDVLFLNHWISYGAWSSVPCMTKWKTWCEEAALRDWRGGLFSTLQSSGRRRRGSDIRVMMWLMQAMSCQFSYHDAGVVFTLVPCMCTIICSWYRFVHARVKYYRGHLGEVTSCIFPTVLSDVALYLYCGYYEGDLQHSTLCLWKIFSCWFFN